MRGYICPSILWHLLHTGPANVTALARVIGHRREPINRVLRRMRASGQIVTRPNSSDLLELTVKGLDAARTVHVSQVEIAPTQTPLKGIQP